MSGFHTTLPGTLPAAETKDKRPDRSTEDTLVEEDIVED
jgi:hypothetical protein